MKIKMKMKILALCLSLASVNYAAQNQAARAQKKAVETVDEKLISCVKNGDADCVARALTTGASAHAVDGRGVAALTLAAQGTSERVVRMLLDAGADVNNTGDDEGSPLCRTALFGRKEIAEMLLTKGAKINIVCDSDHGDTPLMQALMGAMYGDMPDEWRGEVAAMSGGDEGREDDAAKETDEARNDAEKLREALNAPRDSFLAIARSLLTRGADVNVIASCDVGETALIYAAMGANVEMVKEILSKGADVNKGMSPLALLREFEREYEKGKRLALPALSTEQSGMLTWIEKTRAEREEIKGLLKAAGAKELEGEDDGERGGADVDALEEAAGESFSDVIIKDDMKDFARLVDAYAAHPLGARVLPEALRIAIIYARTEIVKLLLERGTNPDPDDGMASKHPPLVQAAHSGQVEYVRMLLDAGADVNRKDKDGYTALDAAELYASSSEEHRAIVELLKARNAKGKK